ncbi:MAG: PLP-dependent aspartate aminotransferase family protein [Helicobacteraceae bacterium]|jgi:cystathionine gamma-synthase|nr:PLP-dependent aspartate aminotransferase family protein [Helicobacteraceae bacterium]
MKKDSLCVHGAYYFDEKTGAVSAPIYQSAPFRHPKLGVSTGFDYSRSINPTRTTLEMTIAKLEGAEYGLAFASGMGAISAIAKLFAPKDHVVVSSDLYGGTYRLFHEYYEKYGIEFSFVDTSDPEMLRSAIRRDTKAFFIETPSNPMMKISDIQECANLIHHLGGILIVDNTFLTPYFQNPLEFGADIVVHSASKYLSGHNDTLAGLIALCDEGLEAQLREAQKSEGASLSPFDAWLVMRGIKTLALRMEKHHQNGVAVSEFLLGHKEVEKVFYAARHKQSRGGNGMVSFYVKDRAKAESVLERVEMILFAESLGGVESLITYPLVQTHGAIPEEMRNAVGVNDRLLRLSCGIENAEDIIRDLDRALS